MIASTTRARFWPGAIPLIVLGLLAGYARLAEAVAALLKKAGAV